MYLPKLDWRKDLANSLMPLRSIRSMFRGQSQSYGEGTFLEPDSCIPAVSSPDTAPIYEEQTTAAAYPVMPDHYEMPAIAHDTAEFVPQPQTNFAGMEPDPAFMDTAPARGRASVVEIIKAIVDASLPDEAIFDEPVGLSIQEPAFQEQEIQQPEPDLMAYAEMEPLEAPHEEVQPQNQFQPQEAMTPMSELNLEQRIEDPIDQSYDPLQDPFGMGPLGSIWGPIGPFGGF